MAGTRALGVEIPEDFDITITSTTDDEATVRRAVGGLSAADADPDADAADGDAAADGDDEGADDDAAADEADGEDGADDDQGDGEEDGDEPPAPRRARDDGREDYEEPQRGETPEQRMERIERNVSRIQRLNAKLSNKDQRIQILEEQLRAARDGKPPKEEAAAREAAPAPKFEFPSFDEWSEQAANQGRSLEEYTDERSDARVAFKSALAQRDEQARLASEARNAVVAAHTTRIAAIRELHTDYDDVIATSRAPMTPTMQVTMMQRDYGPAIAYYCSSTPEGLKAAKRIAALPPIEQIEELGILGRSKAIQALMPPSANGRRRSVAPEPRRKRADTPVDDEDVAAAIVPDEDDEDDPPPTRRSRTKSSRAPNPLPTVAGGARRARELADLSPDEYIVRMDEEDRKAGRRR